MSEPTPAAAPAEDTKKRLREKVDKLLARDPCKTTGSIRLGRRVMKYTAIAAFVPVSAGGLDEKRDEPEAAVFTTSYFLDDADPLRGRCASSSTAARDPRRSGSTWVPSVRSASSFVKTARCRRRPIA